MAKPPPIPRYRRRRRKDGIAVRVMFFLMKLGLAFLIISTLWVLAYRFINPPTTATMISDQIAGRGAVRDWMPIETIDRDMVRAAIAAEDSKFCSHGGFDFEAIEDAMKRNASGGRIRGGSTISQQTAKTTFLWNGGGYARKGLEAWFTFLVEQLWGKRRIMEVYLNNAETGIGTYGVNAGALRYFGHDSSRLTANEAARIAAVLPLPKKRGAKAPKGFTRRYGGTISARLGVVARDGLDSCVYRGAIGPVPTVEPEARGRKAPAPEAQPRPVPGSEYEVQPADVEPADSEVLPEAAPASPPQPPPEDSPPPIEPVPPPTG